MTVTAESTNYHNRGSVAEAEGDNILWKFETGDCIYGTPIIENDILYVGSLDSCFYAINSETGTQLWRYKTQNRVYSTAVKYENILCFESGNILYGLNLMGELLWTYTLYDSAFLNQHDEWDYYHSSPCLVGNVVYIGSERGMVFGIDIRNGEKVFQCQTPTADHTIETTPAVYNNTVYFGDWNGVFYAYNLSSGNMVWQYDTKNDVTYGWVNAIVTDPIIFNDAVYFAGRSCNLYCLDARNGEKRWLRRDGGDMWLVGGPTIVDSAIIIGSSYQHTVRSIDALTGLLRWSSNVEYRENGKPVIDGDLVYIGTESDVDSKVGTLCALNKSDGKMKARLIAGTQIYPAPVIHNGKIFFGGADGYVTSVNQQEFLDVSNPDTYLTSPDTIDLGNLNKNGGTFSTKVYVYNGGNAPDSVNAASYTSQVKLQPSVFWIAPHDSQAVTLTISLSALKPKRYQCTVRFFSNCSFVPINYGRIVTFTVVDSPAEIGSDDETPAVFSLSQNFPNPFNPTTLINYTLPKTSNVRLTLFNVIGEEVAILVEGMKQAGSYSYRLDGDGLASGVYIYRLRADELVQTRKLLLVK
jgi:outer membrane protein assembly factor BamB